MKDEAEDNMSKYTKGDRIGAILSASDRTVFFLGYGTYEGQEVPDEDAGGCGPLLRSAGATNPKLVLDNGTVVWGCECWWGSEEGVKNHLRRLTDEGYAVEAVNIAEVRRRFKN